MNRDKRAGGVRQTGARHGVLAWAAGLGAALLLMATTGAGAPPAHHRSAAPSQRIGAPWAGPGPHVTVHLFGGQSLRRSAFVPPLSGTYRITLPLVLGARRLSEHLPAPGISQLGTYGRRGVTHAFIVPGSVDAVASWAAKRLSALGYVNIGQVTGGQVLEYRFAPAHNPRKLQVNLGLAADGASQTFIQYWVTAVAVPPRPATTRIRGPIRSVTALVYRAGASGPSSLHVNNPAAERALLRALNSLPVSPLAGVVINCPAITISYQLDLVTKTGERFRVDATFECGLVSLTRLGHHPRTVSLAPAPALGQAFIRAGIPLPAVRSAPQDSGDQAPHASKEGGEGT